MSFWVEADGKEEVVGRDEIDAEDEVFKESKGGLVQRDSGEGQADRGVSQAVTEPQLEVERKRLVGISLISGQLCADVLGGDAEGEVVLFIEVA